VVGDGLRFTTYSEEACIAPAVPVLRTLDDFRRTGDAVTRLEALLNPGVNIALQGVCKKATPNPFAAMSPRKVPHCLPLHAPHDTRTRRCTEVNSAFHPQLPRRSTTFSVVT
jgi:hypothetical protein